MKETLSVFGYFWILGAALNMLHFKDSPELAIAAVFACLGGALFFFALGRIVELLENILKVAGEMRTQGVATPETVAVAQAKEARVRFDLPEPVISRRHQLPPLKRGDDFSALE